MHLSLHRPSPPPPTPSKDVLILFIGYEKKTRLKEDFGTLFFFKKKSNFTKSITASLLHDQID